MGIAEIAANLHRTTGQLAGDWVTYERGTRTLRLRAVPATITAEHVDALGVLHVLRVPTFLVTAADLIFAGAAVEPREGDTIKRLRGASLEIYEVMPRGGGPAWQWSDAHFQAYRVHTKLVNTL